MAIMPSVDVTPMQKLNPAEFREEAHSIADWWLNHAQDQQYGGFYGQIAWNNQPKADAEKCIILNARILWFFSEFARFSPEPRFRAAAQRAYDYVVNRFVDQHHGGVVWMLNARGHIADDRKQVYGQAFAIYGLCAYYDLTKEPKALDLALQLFGLLQGQAVDADHGGYFEAFSRSWGPLQDIRLSEKEDNSPKTMNTHLHILEAYTALFKSVKAVGGHQQEAVVGQALRDVLKVYCERIVDLESGHVRMFMENDWRDRSLAYSFGHDIESSWLIEKALVSLETANPRYFAAVTRLAEVALRDGIQADGVMGDEYHFATGTFGRSAWWVQAEAMVGFTQRWAHEGGDDYLQVVQGIWQQLRSRYKDVTYGEWHWFSTRDVPPERSEYKVGAWKAPYHSGRAMMMMCQLLAKR